jgi:TrmH family RNA methyltransferase
VITSKSNPLIKSARSLRQSRARKETGLFLIEGLQPVGAAIEANWEIEVLLYAPELLESEFGHQTLRKSGGRIEEVSKDVFESIAEKDNPQGLIAMARQRHVLLDSIAPSGSGVALCAAQDPGNVGSILRTLEAVGGEALYLLDGGVDPYHPSVIRASMGASFVVPFVQVDSAEFLSWGKTRSLHLIGTSSRAARHYRDVESTLPWVLLLGSEQKGLSADLQRACDVVVSIPMLGRISSLNLAVAAGVLLYWYTGAPASASRS